MSHQLEFEVARTRTRNGIVFNLDGCDKPCTKERLPLVEDRVRERLDQLSGRLGDADWLDGASAWAT
jgi:hypothetical protein